MWDWSIARSISVTSAARIDRLRLERSGYVPIGYPFTNDDWNRVSSENSYNLGVVWKPDSLDVVSRCAARRSGNAKIAVRRLDCGA